MCTRYFLLKDHLAEVFRALGLEPKASFVSRYNFAPGQFLPAIRRDAAGALAAAELSWGLLPSWAAADGARPVNARAETLEAKPSFRDAYRQRRCLLPASGFYEWEKRDRARLPWAFQRPDGHPFCLAGLWESRPGPDGTAFETCALVTTGPNGVIEPIHLRMPVILGPDQAVSWLDPRAGPGQLAPLLLPVPDDQLAARRVSTRMNRAAVDDAACLLPPEPGSESGPQISLEFA
jgi:putative SOS response-associated peptidase YedK